MADTYLGEFVRYLRTRTEAPPPFHLHAGLASLSVALGTNVWTDGWARPIYPNLWSIVIAKSGYGKSVPLDMAQSIVDMASLGERVLPDSFSAEALYDILAARPTGLFVLQEFASFLGVLGRDYNGGSEQWLTSLYDVPKVDRRVTRLGEKVLNKPCITILGASSPSWFSQAYRESSLSGGFLARFLFCPSDELGPYIGHPGPRNEGVEASLAAHLQMAGQLSGKADFSRVQARFNEWDRLARERLRKDCPPEFSGMRSRAGVMVLKASLLFMASRDPETLTVQAKDLDNAIRHVEKSHELAERFLSEEVAHDRDDADRLRLLEIVKRRGRVAWSQALKDSHMTADKFKRAVDTLQASDRLRVESGPNSGRVLVDPQASTLRVVGGTGA